MRLLRGLLVPLAGYRLILRDAAAECVRTGEAQHAVRVTALSGLTIQIERAGCVALDTAPLFVHRTKTREGQRLARAGLVFERSDDGAQIGWLHAVRT